MSNNLSSLRRLFGPDASGAPQAACIQVVATGGSVPREVGAWMWVSGTRTYNTIGGGNLEWLAMARARACLAGADVWGEMDVPLGPSTGQCCGGRVRLRIAPLDDAELVGQWQGALDKAWPVMLLGGGHVGRALVRQLALLPTTVYWRDSRDDVFEGVPAAPVDTRDSTASLYATCDVEVSQPLSSAVWDAPRGAAVLIMSHSHQEDFEVTVACLQRHAQRADLRFVGLIGSATKWASFRSRLRARGFDEEAIAQITCPIGMEAVRGKQPELIALSVAAQLATVFQADAGARLIPRGDDRAL